MSYVAHHNEFALSQPVQKSGAEVRKAGVLRRILSAVFQSQHEQDEQAAAYLIEQSGGRLTDDLERRMTSRLSGWDWYPR